MEVVKARRIYRRHFTRTYPGELKLYLVCRICIYLRSNENYPNYKKLIAAMQRHRQNYKIVDRLGRANSWFQSLWERPRQPWDGPVAPPPRICPCQCIRTSVGREGRRGGDLPPNPLAPACNRAVNGAKRRRLGRRAWQLVSGDKTPPPLPPPTRRPAQQRRRYLLSADYSTFRPTFHGGQKSQ